MIHIEKIFISSSEIQIQDSSIILLKEHNIAVLGEYFTKNNFRWYPSIQSSQDYGRPIISSESFKAENIIFVDIDDNTITKVLSKRLEDNMLTTWNIIEPCFIDI